MKLLRRFRNRKPRQGEVTMSMVVTRKDGRVEDLGVVARGKTRWKPEVK